MNWLRKLVEQHVEKTVAETIETALSPERLEPIIVRIAAKRFAETPDAELTEAGFNLALGIALRKHWPHVSRHQATLWLLDYLGVPFGAAGYIWTPAAADDLARQYVTEFGEPRDA